MGSLAPSAASGSPSYRASSTSPFSSSSSYSFPFVDSNRMALCEFMTKNSLLDDDELKAVRQKALTLLLKECLQWARDCLCYESRGQLILHGSYAIDSHLRTSDIDAVFIGPSNLHRSSFMTDMPWRLQNLNNNSSSSETAGGQSVMTRITPISGARFPILKLRMFGAVDIDLQYCESLFYSVPPNISDVWTWDDICRSFRDNACSIAVLNQLNVMIIQNGAMFRREFSLAMRAIKVWAQKRNIYGSWRARPGCLSCLSFTILLVYAANEANATDCGSNIGINVSAVTLMRQMFKRFGVDWPWPQPVFLPVLRAKARMPEIAAFYQYQSMSTYQVPLNFGLMPIMTPMCITTEPVDVIKFPHDLLRIKTAMKEAYEMLSRDTIDWDAFFEAKP